MIELYGHPFSAFTWKVLIALYERDVPFAFRLLAPDQPTNLARIAELSPTGQFPALVDGARELTQSNTVIEYCDRFGDAPPMVPIDPDDALDARMYADVFDDYVAAPMQRIVGDALRSEAFGGGGDHDSTGIAAARDQLRRAYAWLDRKLAGRDWSAAGRFTTADCAAAPALFYADWVEPVADAHATLRAYRARLLAHPSVARAVDEARPYRSYFPLGAPDRD